MFAQDKIVTINHSTSFQAEDNDSIIYGEITNHNTIDSGYSEKLIYDSINNYLKMKEEYFNDKLTRITKYNKNKLPIEVREYLIDSSVCITYFRDNGLPSSKSYRTNNDIEIRDQITWYTNGKIASYGEYCILTDNNRDSLEMKYQIISNFGVAKVVMWLNDKCGIWRYWNEDGILIKEEFWENGDLVSKTYDAQGNLIGEGKFENAFNPARSLLKR